MNAPSFTPGPWRRAGHRQVTTRGGLPICEVFSGAVGIEHADANEYLIAEAPGMFLALQMSLAALEGCNGDRALDPVVRAVRGTLLRAGGMQPERWTPALFLVDKRVITLPEASSECEAMRAAEDAARARHDVEWLAVRPGRQHATHAAT